MYMKLWQFKALLELLEERRVPGSERIVGPSPRSPPLGWKWIPLSGVNGPSVMENNSRGWPVPGRSSLRCCKFVLPLLVPSCSLSQTGAHLFPLWSCHSWSWIIHLFWLIHLFRLSWEGFKPLPLMRHPSFIQTLLLPTRNKTLFNYKLF